MSGDLTTPANSFVTLLNSVNASGAGTYGNKSSNPRITVDAKGRITTIVEVSWSGATPPSNTGTCAINTQLGTNTSGAFRANGACTNGTVILVFTKASTNGWVCSATDLTTGGITPRQTAYSTTSATFAATMTASDLVTYQCSPF